MRSVHIIGSRLFGGAERFFLRLTAALVEHGEAVLCVTQPNSELNAHVHADSRQRTVKMRSIFDPIARARIGSAIRRFDAQIVQTYMGRATRLTHLKSQRKGPVHIARLGGYYSPKGYRHAHAWVANTRGIRDYLVAQGFASERVFHIGNFVEPPVPVDPHELDRLRRELNLENDAWVIVCIGRLHRNKAFDVMLDALARLPERILSRPMKLLIVGDGPERDALREQADRSGIAGRIRWLGWQHSPELYLKLAHVFVCPSRHEPLGNVILEAWNQELPVLATDTGGPGEIIQPGVNGALVAVEDTDDLAAGLQTLLEAEPDYRRALAAAGRRTLAVDHAKEKVVKAYLELYARLYGDH